MNITLSAPEVSDVQMAADWPALLQYYSQKTRTKRTLGIYGAGLGPVAVRLPELQPFYHSWALQWALTEPGHAMPNEQP